MVQYIVSKTTRFPKHCSFQPAIICQTTGVTSHNSPDPSDSAAVTFLGWWVKRDPFNLLSDLQRLGDEKVTAWITWWVFLSHEKKFFLSEDKGSNWSWPHPSALLQSGWVEAGRCHLTKMVFVFWPPKKTMASWKKKRLGKLTLHVCSFLDM